MGQKVEIALPSELFRPFIEYYKYVETDLTGIYKIVPITAIELYFNFTHIRLFSAGYYNLNLPQIHLAGLQSYDQNAYSEMFGTEKGGGFVVVFRPHGFNSLFRIKGSDFSRYCLGGDLVFKNDINRLWEKLNACAEVNAMKGLFEDHFSGPAKACSAAMDLLDDMISRMSKTSGMIRVSQLCDIYNITPRSLERRFMEEIGIPAKEMLQIFRINRAIRLLAEDPKVNLAGISYLSGYFDQAHFIKDIKKITGMSPGHLLGREAKKRAVHNRLFIQTE